MFKKITLYTVESPNTLINKIVGSSGDFDNFKFKSPTAMERKRMGFSPTTLSYEELVGEVSGDVVLKVTTQEKKPNPNKVKFLVNEKEEAFLEANPEETSVTKQITKVFKEEAEEEVLQETFPSEEKHSFVVIRKDGLILVEGSAKQAENIISLIRKTIGSLPAIPYEPKGDVLGMLKGWVQKDVCDTIVLGEKATLIDVNENEYKAKGALGGDTKVAAILKEDSAIVTAVEVGREYIKKVIVDDQLVFSGITFDKEFIEDEESEATSLILQMNEVFLLVDDVIGRLK